MIAFENDFPPLQIAAQPGAGKPKPVLPAVARGAPTALAGRAGGSPEGGFQIVFEAEVRSLPSRPGTPAAPAAKPAAAGASGFQPVFDRDSLPPLPPPQAQTANKVPLWDNGGFGFSDILDIINPLQHVPVISTIYRAETGDQIGAIPRILGSMLFGGGLIGAAVGAATAAINLAIVRETGKDIGAHLYTAIFGEDGKTAKTTNIAQKPAPAAPATASGKPRNLLAAPLAPSTVAAIPPASAKAIPAAAPTAPAPPTPAPAAKAGPPRGGVRVTGGTAPPTSLSAAASQSVTSQFRRAAWYRKNQDTLAAQARELALAKAAAEARAAKSTGAGNSGPRAKAVTGKPNMLSLFTGKAVAGKSGGVIAKSKPTIGRPAPIPKAAMAREMSKAMAKYEQLLKSRIAAGAGANKLR